MLPSGARSMMLLLSKFLVETLPEGATAAAIFFIRPFAAVVGVGLNYSSCFFLKEPKS